MLRYTLGLTLAIAIGYGLNWPLAYTLPVFLAKFFADRPNPGRDTIKQLFWAMTATVLVALAVTRGLTEYPLILLVLIALVMFWAYYLFQSPDWNFFALILMVAMLLIPYVGLIDSALPLVLAKGLMLSGVGAVTLYWLMYQLFPACQPLSEAIPALASREVRSANASKALFVSLPVIAYFYYFQVSGALLTMAFIGILSLQLTKAGSIKLSQFLLITNLVGGLLAVLVCELLVTAPWFPLMLAVLALLASVFSQHIYSTPTKAPLYAAVFSALLVVLGSVLASGDKALSVSFYARIGQIGLAGLYLIVAARLVDSHQQGKSTAEAK